MFRTQYLNNSFKTALLVLFVFASIGWAEETTGRSILDMARKKNAATEKPAYINRSKSPTQTIVLDVNSQKKDEIQKAKIDIVQTPEETADTNVQPVKASSLQTSPKRAGATAGKSEKPAVDKLLQMLSAESVFVVRANRLEDSTNKMDQFLTGTSLLPTTLSTRIHNELTSLLGDPNLKTIKMGGDFAVFGVAVNEKISDQNSSDMFIGFLVPVTYYKKFLSENPNVGKPDNKEVSKIQRQDKPELLVTRVGKYALITSSSDTAKLIEITKLMSESESKGKGGLVGILSETQIKQACNEPFWAYANVKLAGPIVSSQMEKSKKILREMEQKGQSPMPSTQQQLDAQMAFLNTLMEETKSITVVLRPEPKTLNITATITAVPDTNVAKMLTAGSQPRENKLLGYMEDDAMMNLACSIDGQLWEKLGTKFLEPMTSMTGQAMGPKDANSINAMTTELIGSIGQALVMSVKIDSQSKSPFSGKYVFEVNDVNSFNKAADKMVETANSPAIVDMYKKMGMKINLTMKRGSDNYQGITINSAKLTMISTEPNSMQGKMMGAMYGDGFNYKWAVVDRLCVCALGKNADTDLRQLIDTVKQGGPKQAASQVKAALGQLADLKSANFSGTCNLVREMQAIFAIMRQAKISPDVNTPAMSIPDVNIPISTCGAAFAGKLDNGQVILDVAISKEHLGEISGLIRAMKSKQKPTENRPDQQPVAEEETGNQ
jgi:hypothetical protein